MTPLRVAGPPSFLVIVTDQHRADHLGCYGNPVLRTPNIDRIAAGGTRFERFHVATPVCMPNRASLMTGRMPSLHGVRCNGIPLPQTAVTFADLLRAAGWRTALIGKSHLQPMTDLPPEMPRTERHGRAPPPGLEEAERDPARGGDAYAQEALAGWRAEPARRVVTPFYGFDHVELCTMHGDLVHGDYWRWLAERTAEPERLRGRANALPDPRYVGAQAWRTRVPEELYPTRYIEERTLARLDQAAAARRAGDTAPFLVVCSFPDPHHPFTPPGRYWDMYDPDAMPLPPSHGASAPTPAVEALRRIRAEGRANTSGVGAFAATPREVQEAIALTYGMIAMIDDAVGRLLDRLVTNGLAADTVVIFTSDHGDLMGDHGLLLKSALHFRGLTRVPLIWREPDGGAAPLSRTLASAIDLPASILDRAGLAPANGMQGRSLLPCLRGEELPELPLLIEEDGHAPTFGLDVPVRVRTLLSGRHRLSVTEPSGWVELYDLDSDLHEMRNLADEPAHAGLRGAMFELMARRMAQLADTSPFPPARA
jgi:arylsulfatase A-like enzyme